jgi:hypothetical protein
MAFNKASLSVLALAIFAGSSFGQGYVPGQILAVRIGSGGANALDPSGINNNMSFLEFGKIGTGSQAFTRFTGTATTSIAFNGVDPLAGTLTRSANGIWFGVAGIIGAAAAAGTDVNSLASSTNARRAWIFPFTANTTNSLGTSSNNFGTTALSGVAIRSAVTVNGAQVLTANDVSGGSGARYFTMTAGSAGDGSVIAGQSVRYIITAGNFMWFSTATGIFRAPIPTTGGDVTATQVLNGTDIVQFEFINNQTMVVADKTIGLQRYTLSGADTWTNVTGPAQATNSGMITAGTPVTGVTTDGISVWASTSTTSTSGANQIVMLPYSASGTAVPVVNQTAGTNFVYRGVSLVPEFSIIGSCPTGTSGEVRIAMRTQGTAADPVVRSCRIGTLNINTGRIVTTNATIPMRGHFADMTVDRNGNTLILCTTPNPTLNGYNYSIIRVSADGTATDEGPLSGGLPSAAAPAGFVPIQIRASSTTDQASVLFWTTASNNAQLGIVTLPTSIGAGVSTIATWGPFASGTAAQRAVGLAYTRVSNQPAILYSNYAAPNGNYEIRTASDASTSASFAAITGVASLRAIGLTFDGSDQARVLNSGSNAYAISSGAPNNPQQFRVDTIANGGTVVTTGTLYTRNSTVNNTVTSQAIFGQVQPLAINWDAGSSTSFLTHTGTSGSFTSADQRTNIPGSYRGWQMASATNNVTASTYRFFPGVNFN